jgi:hypothetical protein
MSAAAAIAAIAAIAAAVRDLVTIVVNDVGVFSF